MCVIVQKPQNVDLPSIDILKKCFEKNPHGSGILLFRKDSNILEIHKGMMTFDNFQKTLESLNIQKEDEAVFHFRITTSGGTSAENCHPFPISSLITQLKATEINTPRAFVHNGILGEGDETLKISDTQKFVKDVMSRNEISNFLDDEEVQKYIEKLAGYGNKFYVADAEKKVFKRFGTWTEDSGLYFSNMSWKHSYKNLYNRNYSYSNSYYNNYPYNFSSNNYSNNYYSTNSQIPDFDSVLCPLCDGTMDKMTKNYEFYICPKCGTVYNDDTFEVYSKNEGRWISIPELNDISSLIF